MNNRYLKIFVCVLMVCCLLFSFTASAFAASAPAEIGGFGAAIASVIAESMGIEYDYREFDEQGLQEFFELLEDIQETAWKVKVTAGLTTIAIGQTAVQSIASYVKDQILRDDIQPNSEGLISSVEVRTFDGYHFKNFAGTIRTDAIGPTVSVASWKTQPIGFSFTLTASDPRYASIRFTKISTTNATIDWYYLTNLILNQPSENLGQSTSTVDYYPVLTIIGNQVCLAYVTNNHTYVSRTSSTIGTPIDKTQSVSYVSQSIDTTVTDNIPSSGGLLLTFPTSASSSVTDALEDLQNLVLENSQSIEYEYTDDVGQPMPYDTTIADTPWTDLAGSLDELKSYLNSIHVSISGNISDTLTGIGEAVDELAGTIESADVGFVQSFIDGFLDVFRSAFDGVSTHLGIWHYVVSWIGSISSCFSWCLSAVSSAGSIFMAPIYATFAGTVVVAVYRRFGK